MKGRKNTSEMLVLILLFDSNQPLKKTKIVQEIHRRNFLNFYQMNPPESPGKGLKVSHYRSKDFMKKGTKLANFSAKLESNIYSPSDC